MSGNDDRHLADQQTITPFTTIDYRIDLAPAIPENSGLLSVIWLAEAKALPGSTTDSTPGDRLIGSGLLDGTYAIQRFGDGVDGNVYKVKIRMTFEDGQKDELWFYQPCREPW